jgi:hypothetical protein
MEGSFSASEIMRRLVKLVAMKETGAPDETLRMRPYPSLDEWHLRLDPALPAAIKFYVFEHPAGQKVFPPAFMSSDCAHHLTLRSQCLTVLKHKLIAAGLV